MEDKDILAAYERAFSSAYQVASQRGDDSPAGAARKAADEMLSGFRERFRELCGVEIGVASAAQ